MSKYKEARCRYNANRHLAGLVIPFCTWREQNKLTMPPHIFWNSLGSPICIKCKAYIEAEEFQK